MKDIKLSNIFRDGMVLQRGEKTRVFGEAEKNSKIKIEFLNEEYETITDENGKWNILLKKLNFGGPYDMIIYGKEKIVIRDILIGDVWLCSGQSNMELPISRVLRKFEDEILTYENNNIRQFTFNREYNFNNKVESLENGTWLKVNKEEVLDFSAVGYFYAKELYEKYKVPIGLISTAVGGSPIEAWMSEESLAKYPRFNEDIFKCKDDEYVKQKQKDDDDKINSWYNTLNLKDEGLINKYNSEYLDESKWKNIIIPGMWKDTDLKGFKGSVWFRKEVFISKEDIDKKSKIYMGCIIDADEVYINEELVGRTEYRYPPREYEIKEGLLKEGRNIISVRVISNNGIGGFIQDKDYKIIFDDESEIGLSGVWKYKIGCEMSVTPDRTFFQYMPTGLYNGVIYPLRNYNMCGVIWYQGESNTGYMNDYKDLFVDLVNEWRSLWNIGEFPFLYVQLANYRDPNEVGVHCGWAEFREIQRKCLDVNNTGMVISIDIGEYNDLHPLNKKEVGRRLALLARKLHYKEDLVYSSPMYKGMIIENNKIAIHLDTFGSKLLSIGGDINNFEIADESENYYKANAKILKDYIEVWSEKVKKPKYVRYSWCNTPFGINLYNDEGLPVEPFHTKI